MGLILRAGARTCKNAQQDTYACAAYMMHVNRQAGVIHNDSWCGSLEDKVADVYVPNTCSWVALEVLPRIKSRVWLEKGGLVKVGQHLSEGHILVLAPGDSTAQYSTGVAMRLRSNMGCRVGIKTTEDSQTFPNHRRTDCRGLLICIDSERIISRAGKNYL